MIHVIANIAVRGGRREEFLEIFAANVPAVLAEDGCLGYEPTVDADSGLGAQGGVRQNVVTVVEAWRDLDALRAHLQAPHMQDYKAKTNDMVEGVTLQVLRPV